MFCLQGYICDIEGVKDNQIIAILISVCNLIPPNHVYKSSLSETVLVDCGGEVGGVDCC